MENFSARLRLLRKERGLKRSYQDSEYQVSYPSALGLVALADFFGVSLDYLMGRTDKREINR